MSEFKEGQKVVAVGRLDGYRNHLTEGKEYTVTRYDPECVADNGFRFPAYVYVIGDMGKEVSAHHWRLRAID